MAKMTKSNNWNKNWAALP